MVQIKVEVEVKDLQTPEHPLSEGLLDLQSCLSAFSSSCDTFPTRTRHPRAH
jgi:hypothetical protein